MELLTSEQERQLRANGAKNGSRIVRNLEPEDFRPVVKLFCPWGAATWLLTELDPNEPDIGFGLCDLGMGFPEIGSVSLSELASIRGPGGLQIERDVCFTPSHTLQGYAEEAHRAGRIVA
jgi:Protein of unknown function (DUF2958)